MNLGLKPSSSRAALNKANNPLVVHIRINTRRFERLRAAYQKDQPNLTNLSKISSFSSADDYDSPILSKPVGMELQEEELDNVFNYPRNLTDLYEKGEKVGSGSFGVVSVVTHKKTGLKYAVKAIPKKPRSRPCTPGYLLKLQNEVDCMRQLGASLNAVFLHDVFEDHTHLYMVMELCEGGALLDYLAEKSDLNESTIARVMRSVLQFLAQCHGKGVVYRDVKAGNFLFLDKTDQAPLKATDFGLAIRHSVGEEALTSRAGTPAYMAPEVILQEYDCKCDIWSAGILAFQLLTGRFPFHEDIGSVKLPEVFRATLTEQIDFEAPWIKDAVSEDARAFLKFLLVRDPADRPTAIEALNHPWLKLGAPATASMADSLPKDRQLEATCSQRLQRFATNGHLKQVILNIIIQHVMNDKDALHSDAFSRQSAQLMDQCKDLFASMDLDRSGELTIDELEGGLSAQGVKMGRPELVNLFNHLDVNSDGKLQMSEFLAAFVDWDKLMLNRAWDRWVDSALDSLDTDKSGCIELNEIESLLVNESNGQLRLQEARRMLREADRDRDGRISKVEFKNILRLEATPDSLEAYDDRKQ